MDKKESPTLQKKEIRDKNIPVKDEWVQKDDVRLKRHSIESEMRTCEILSLGEILDLPAFNNIKYGRW